MNARNRGHVIKLHISMLILTSWMLLIAGVSVAAYPAETTSFLYYADNSAAAAQPVTTVTTGQENAKTGLALIDNNDSILSRWTFMVYTDADNNLEDTAISNFREMAKVGSNYLVNVVVQFDRIPGGNASYDNWTDCRRFLVTEGLTPADGHEIMNIGEVNMGDPATLVDFVKWSVSNYPAEKYALIVFNHGGGWKGICLDETSDNDNLNLADMRSALSDISELIGRPLDLIGFDACLMGTTEVAYEVHEYASVMVASEQPEPLSGWPYDAILTQLIATSDINAAELATIIVDSCSLSYADDSLQYEMTAIELNKIDVLVNSLNDLAQALIVYNGTDTQTVKNFASAVTATLNETVIYERHGTNRLDSHGLAIYFPQCQEQCLGTFDSAYTAGAFSLADDTSWDEFVTGYYTYLGDNWITTTKEETPQHFPFSHIDLYEFCQNLIDSEP
jgi:hypothetical protein